MSIGVLSCSVSILISSSVSLVQVFALEQENQEASISASRMLKHVSSTSYPHPLHPTQRRVLPYYLLSTNYP